MTKVKKYQSGIKVLNLSTVLVFVAFYVISISLGGIKLNPRVLASDSEIGHLPESIQSTTHSDNFYSDFSNGPISPAEPTPTPSEPGEKENKENQLDDDVLEFPLSFLGNPLDSHHLAEVSTVQFEQTVLRRTKISLVVLHHSWKSFLS